MKRRAWLFPMAAALAAVLSACAAFVPEPEPSDAGGDASTLSDLRAGRRIYVEKCAGCHRLYDVDSYGDDAWRGHVQDMVGEKLVKLTRAEHMSLLRYLTTLNSKPRP
jgi:mono/diheme cytochrome c family protein